MSCARLSSDKRPLESHEIMVSVRGRRRVEGRTKEAELFETTYCVDIGKLKSLRATNR
ncbi:MAG: hypothetical protein QMC36_06845 [Patescibacteria group bacterium]